MSTASLLQAHIQVQPMTAPGLGPPLQTRQGLVWKLTCAELETQLASLALIIK
jgi:hypothetical protein